MESAQRRPVEELGITFDLLRGNVKTLFVCTVAAAVLGGGYLVVASPTLSFAARLLVVPHNRPLDQAQDVRINEEFLPTQTEIIRSPAVIQQALESVSAPADEVAVLDVIDRLEVQPVLGTNVLNLRLLDTNQQSGLSLMKAIISSYKDYHRETERVSNQETISLLFEHETELRGEITSLQADYNKMHNSGPLVGQDTTTAEPRAKLETVKLLLSAARSRRVQVESYLRQLESLNDGLLAQSGAQPVAVVKSADRSNDKPRENLTSSMHSERVWAASLELLSRMDQEGLVRLQDPLVQQALLDAQARESDLIGRFGLQHPDVRAVQRRIHSLESKLQETVRVAPEILRNELASIQYQQQELTDSYEREFEQCKTLDAALVREQQLLDQIRSVQAIHNTVLSQINRFEIAEEAISGGQSSVKVRVLDAPQLMPDATWPQPVPVLGLCGVLGLAAGFVVVVVGNRFEFAAQS
jgi:uncharacterized protein involved in exopolysaccharide biosynthesis